MLILLLATKALPSLPPRAPRTHGRRHRVRSSLQAGVAEKNQSPWTPRERPGRCISMKHYHTSQPQTQSCPQSTLWYYPFNYISDSDPQPRSAHHLSTSHSGKNPSHPRRCSPRSYPGEGHLLILVLITAPHSAALHITTVRAPRAAASPLTLASATLAAAPSHSSLLPSLLPLR